MLNRFTIDKLIRINSFFRSSLCSDSHLLTPISELSNEHSGSYNKLNEILQTEYGNQQFWNELANNRITWQTPFTKVSEVDFLKGISRWFVGGRLNVSVNCLDRHVERNPDRVAIIWEKDEPGQQEFITYRKLLDLTCQIANLLKEKNVKKHDVVVLYMPTSPIIAASMLACARIGAIHSVIFAGFSPQAIATRIMDAKAKVIITADEAVRGGKVIPLKKIIDEAIELCPPDSIDSVLVYRRTGNEAAFQTKRDICLAKYLPQMASKCDPEIMDSEDMLFILYTSGSTGKPKGVVHSTAGYLLYSGFTQEQVFDFRPATDKFGCVADVGWITGHSYIVYGPLFNGGTTLAFESTPIYPNPGRYWEMIERLKLSHIYLAPTALRLLIKYGDEWVQKYDKSSLRVLGCVGEPLNTDAWQWFHKMVGECRCDIVDTWWQTETGGIIIAPRPSAKDDNIIPGMPMRPFPGIVPVLIDQESNKVISSTEGYGALYLKRSWPGIARTLWNDHDRFVKTYFSKIPGLFYTGDGSHRHKDGSYQITGRIDDVINTTGHRIGTAELEEILDEHEHISESAVVGYPHPVKGEAIYAFVTLKDHAVHFFEEGKEDQMKKLNDQLKSLIRKTLAHYAVPDVIQIVPGLPKTRSGKIMRRILKKIASDNYKDLGDISTLSNPDVVELLIAKHEQLNK